MYTHLLSRYDCVSDYRMDMTAQSVGVDFGIKQTSWSREITLDVKNNLYIVPEKIGFKVEITKNNKPGWFMTSKADRIYHVSSYQRKYIYYELHDLRLYVFQNMSKLDLVKYNDGKDLLVQFYHTGELPVSQIYS